MAELTPERRDRLIETIETEKARLEATERELGGAQMPDEVRAALDEWKAIQTSSHAAIRDLLSR